MERERILSEQRDLHDFLERKADHAFQGDCAARTRLSEAQFELDRGEWRMQDADIAFFMKVACSSDPRGWNSIRRII